ncbi:MAG: hypothetical protein ACYDAZ_06670 [Thermoplasmataceae archaeon]
MNSFATSHTFVKDQDMLIDAVKSSFIELSCSKSFCRRWIEVFVN